MVVAVVVAISPIRSLQRIIIPYIDFFFVIKVKKIYIVVVTRPRFEMCLNQTSFHSDAPHNFRPRVCVRVGNLSFVVFICHRL